MPTIDWSSVRLVVFDVDGTLYSQRRLRTRMALALAQHCLGARSLTTVAVLQAYRSAREALADAEVEAFEAVLLARLAARFRLPEPQLARLLQTWLEERPLLYLAACRYPGVVEFFDAVRASGREVAVLSDYPAADKLAALGLRADHVASARDPAVDIMKPNPRGLEHVLSLARVAPDAAIFIGDRAERDGEAGRRAGVRTYLRTSKTHPDWPCFASFNDLNWPQHDPAAAAA